ncbi:unnamed protein product [Caenorhabditis auriculariae]|uniref:Uncharacterized protein n=1 Tax=Caenorhabditis auriculariae TaxID=2777116 RepID=A0A8S1HYA7_9PELO|nr:unnamed protein product [Caenorhabditis auriculariae]
MIVFTIWAITFASLVVHATATSCLNCAALDPSFNATLQSQLLMQSDVFFYPVVVQKTPACSNSLNVEEGDIGNLYPTIEGEICSKFSRCITLFPNIPNTTFVVRGCLESVLRYKFREDRRLQSPGCYLLRSSPSYPNVLALEFVACVCEGDYCNSASVADVDSSSAFGDSDVRPLGTSSDLLNSSTLFTATFPIALLFLSVFSV